ncbi:MAG: hypothetical protein RO009_23005 [Pseudorhodoplanes sp.]|jgi:hypothetical protein|nr:hypothetical protein [Pseudorhodoplanes sp.]
MTIDKKAAISAELEIGRSIALLNRVAALDENERSARAEITLGLERLADILKSSSPAVYMTYEHYVREQLADYSGTGKRYVARSLVKSISERLDAARGHLCVEAA